MAKKKNSNIKSDPEALQPPLPTLKSHESDENLSSAITSENELDKTAKASSSMEKGIKKRGLSAISDDEETSSNADNSHKNNEKEDEEDDDEFLFIRLRKHIKTHWDKIMERYPNNGAFFRPFNRPTEATVDGGTSIKSHSSTVEEENLSQASLLIHENEHNLLASTIKSLLLLPSFTCKRDDEGRRNVPLISSLLQVAGFCIF
jgi:hypothetical protein